MSNEEKTVYVIDDSPLYYDSTYIKIDILDDEEVAENNQSLDTSNSVKEPEHSTMPLSNSVPVKMQKSKFSHPLRDRVANRVSQRMARLEKAGSISKCSVGMSPNVNYSEIFEFIKVLTNGAKTLKSSTTSIKKPMNVKKMRGLYLKSRKTVSNRSSDSNVTFDTQASN